MGKYRRLLLIDAPVFWIASVGAWAVIRCFHPQAKFGWLVAITGFVTCMLLQLLLIRYGNPPLWGKTREQRRRGFEVIAAPERPRGEEPEGSAEPPDKPRVG